MPYKELVNGAEANTHKYWTVRGRNAFAVDSTALPSRAEPEPDRARRGTGFHFADGPATMEECSGQGAGTGILVEDGSRLDIDGFTATDCDVGILNKGRIRGRRIVIE